MEQVQIERQGQGQEQEQDQDQDQSPDLVTGARETQQDKRARWHGEETEDEEDYYLPPPMPPPILTASQIRQLTTQGFITIPNLPPRLSHALESLLSTTCPRFFSQPTSAKKARFPPSQGTELGYYTVTGEKEFLTLRYEINDNHEEANIPPGDTLDCTSRDGNDEKDGEARREEPISLARDSSTVWREAASLLQRVLYDLSQALEIPISAWDPVLDGALTMPSRETEAGPTLLRMLKYVPGSSGVAERHYDLGLLTLCVGSEDGLQVWERDEGVEGEGEEEEGMGGEGRETDTSTSPFQVEPENTTPQIKKANKGAWIPATGPTILVGRTLHLLSKGKALPGLHRVIGNPNGRSSVVFPLRASTKRSIPMDVFGGWGEVEGREIDEFVRHGIVNINAVPEIRQRQRQLRKAASGVAQPEGRG